MERIQTAKARREQEARIAKKQEVEKERTKKEAKERQTKEQLEAKIATDADLKLLEEKNRQAVRDTAMQLWKQSSGNQNSQSQALDIQLRDARKEADSLKRKSCDSSAGHSHAEDLVHAFRALRGAYGTGISVMHGFPILISGLNNKNTIRELLEVNHLYNLICKSGTFEIPETRTLCYSTLIKDDTASSTSAPEVRPLMLPQNLTSYDKVSFESKGFGNQKDLCLPISVLEESKIQIY